MKINKLFYFLIPFLILKIFCATVDISKLSQEELLLYSYKEKSNDYLNIFFERWQKEIPSIKDTEQLAEEEKIVYEIFQHMYNPVDENFYAVKKDSNNKKIVYPTTPNYPDFTNHYMILQNSIRYKFVDSLIFWDSFNINNNGITKSKIKEGVIEDFRPKLPFTSKVVYSTKKYENILRKFFTDSLIEQDSRARFMWKVALITPSRGYMSHPIISLEIKQNCTEAIVNLHFAFGGSKAKIEKKNGEWDITSIRNTWIE